MDQELIEKLNQLEVKVEETRVLSQKTYKLFYWTVIATAVTFILPLIALVFVIPFFLKSLNSLTGL
jgi:hypothetical protein